MDPQNETCETTNDANGQKGESRPDCGAYHFEQVLIAELDAITPRRAALEEPVSEEREDGDIEQRAFDSGLTGLSFSGGGIRSATFNLGVLQGLAKAGLLRRIDFLSTVSGGGYIGGWFQALLGQIDKATDKNAGSADAIIAAEKGLAQGSSGRIHEHYSIQLLRSFSNYLTPKIGLFSADTWSLGTTYLRNVLLNLILLILSVSILLLLPRLVAVGQGTIVDLITARDTNSAAWLYLMILLTAALTIFISVRLGGEIGHLKDQNKAAPNARDAKYVWKFIVLPTMLAALLLSIWIPLLHDKQNIVLLGVASEAYGQLRGVIIPLYVSAVTVLVWLFAYVGAIRKWGSARVDRRKWLWVLFYGAIAGLVVGVLVTMIAGHLNAKDSAVLTPVYGTPLACSVLLLVTFLQVGLVGSHWSSLEREWLSRVGGCFLMVACAWLLLFGIAILGPLAFQLAETWVSGTLTTGWVITTLAGLLASRGGADTIAKSVTRRVTLVVAPYVFLLGLFILLSAGLNVVLHDAGQFRQNIGFWLSGSDTSVQSQQSPVTLSRAQLELSPPTGEVRVGDFTIRLGTDTGDDSVADSTLSLKQYIETQKPINSFPTLITVLVVALLLLLFTSRRINVNDFSLHNMYRNRLVRCYLGACVKPGQRYRNPFLGLSHKDDIDLYRAGLDSSGQTAIGPYPIINSAINLVGGRNLAWQERKSTAFALTPLFCGFSRNPQEPGCYRRSTNFAAGARRWQSSGGKIQLGDAMATSGAAANPNMGYHTTAALSALLTIFNVRIGRWVGNPYNERTWNRATPAFAIWYYLREGLGATHSHSPFVNLSDGGHFENLGIYELVRRRCRYIICCDAGADPEYRFEDLGNAIRKCRIDFSVNIDINVDGIRERDERGIANAPCAVGSVDYGNGRIGTLLYIKASRIPTMSTDIVQYADAHPDFPHQTTGDQFFSESQFESYRKLGESIISMVLANTTGQSETCPNVATLFADLREQWIAPSGHTQDSFTRLTGQYMGLIRQLAGNDELDFLDRQFYPEWSSLVTDSFRPEPVDGVDRFRQASETRLINRLHELPDDPERLRAGFYFCNQLIQLMEDAYLDLDLQNEWNHPDNSGWMNLFKHWSWAPMFRATWAIGASTFGRRFQSFCGRQLGLRLGSVSCKKVESFATDTGLNQLEKYQIAIIAEQFPDISVYAFIIGDLEALGNKDILTLPPISFNVGYAIIQDCKLTFFRIQDHLRNMGLGRKALQSLIDYCRDCESASRARLHLAEYGDIETLLASLQDTAEPESGYRNFKAMFQEAKHERALQE